MLWIIGSQLQDDPIAFIFNDELLEYDGSPWIGIAQNIIGSLNGFGKSLNDQCVFLLRMPLKNMLHLLFGNDYIIGNNIFRHTGVNSSIEFANKKHLATARIRNYVQYTTACSGLQ